ncbi:hypothetical protein [Bartonella henselae]|uniref:hypothetical protein n=1 Tax=Bartonella henselae TaxID=38323 RepID=UPI0004BAE98A|nr:hypothetical protein [Bartonella henselae]
MIKEDKVYNKGEIILQNKIVSNFALEKNNRPPPIHSTLKLPKEDIAEKRKLNEQIL